MLVLYINVYCIYTDVLLIYCINKYDGTILDLIRVVLIQADKPVRVNHHHPKHGNGVTGLQHHPKHGNGAGVGLRG